MADWNAAADIFPNAWLWHRTEAIEAYASWPNNSDCSFAIVDQASGGQIVAILPLLRSRSHRLLSRLESTGGLATADNQSPRQIRNIEAAARNHLLNIAQKFNAHRVDLSLSPLAPRHILAECPSVNPLVMLGCQEASTQSWIVDLRDTTDDVLWQRVDQRVRKSVKKARAASVTIREATAMDLPAYLQLHAENCRRNGLPQKPPEYFKSIFETFGQQAMALILAAIDTTGSPIAFHTFAIYKKAALYWTVASSQQALLCGANDLVQWEALRQFRARGVDFYETGEAFPALDDSKLKRISDFKKGFGGRLHPYFRGTIITRPILSAGLDLARALRAAYTANSDEH